MIELQRWITALRVEDAGAEEAAATRDRLKERFPKNATRRMTQLGLMLGSVLEPLAPGVDDALVYASTFAEARTLEAYLDSFPAPSPTLFQTSIHPSAVQQNLILRQQAVREFFPVTGGQDLPVRALLVALLCEAPRVLLCGGEERGGWLLEHQRASDRTFAFALALSTDPAGALGHIALSTAGSAALSSVVPSLCPLSLPVFFEHLRDRRPIDALVLPGRRLVLRWLA
jgi:hypothetical protein